MAWAGSTTFDGTYHFQDPVNYGAFMTALNYLHKIVDDDGSGVAPSSDLVIATPANDDYFLAYGPSISSAPFANPQTASGVARRPFQPTYCINAVHNWVDWNLGIFAATAKKTGGVWSPLSDYSGQPSLYQWNNSNGSTSFNLYEYINVLGRDGAGNQTGFTRKRPAWIGAITATTVFTDDAGNSTNVPVFGDVAYRTTDGRKYIYAGGGNWTLAADQGVPVRVLTGCGVPALGDCCTYPEFWQELYSAIIELRWTFSLRMGTLGGLTIGAEPSGLINKCFDRFGDRSSLVSEAAAKAAALGDFNATETTPAGSVGGVANPLVRAFVHDHLSSTSPSYEALIECFRACINVQGFDPAVASTAPLLARTIEYYYRAKPYGSYPLDGLGSAISDLSGNLALWRTEGPTIASVSESAVTFPPSGTVPNWPTTTTVSTAVELDKDGGVIADGFVVHRWDVAGGLPWF